MNPRDRYEVETKTIMDLAEYFPGGGTDFQKPLDAALDCLRESRFKKGDIIFITDGECQVDPQWAENFRAEKEKLGFSLFSILIDMGPASLGTLKEFSDRPDFVNEADPQRFGSRDLFGSQDHVERVIAPDAACQTRAAAPCGDSAKVEFRQPDPRAFSGCQSEVTCERKFQSTAQAVAVEHSDDWLREILNGAQDSEALIEQGLQAPHSLNSLRELLEVHPDGEVLFAGTANHNGPHAGVVRKPFDFVLQGVHERQTHSISRSIVDHQGFDRTIPSDQ
jgi:hypothetical protein